MRRIVGVELAGDGVRAVVLGPWGTRPRATAELAWDPTRPAELVERLRAQLGPASGIALAVGLGFLHVKHASLPPVPPAERRRILALEPDRFFPVPAGTPTVASVAAGSNLCFAVDGALLESWIAAFETWAPVERAEPAPLSLARTLAGGDGTFDLPAGPAERGTVDIRGGTVRAVRRMPEAAETSAGASPAPFALALGAARGVGAPLDDGLLPEPVIARIRRRRTRRTAVTAVVCAAALVFALGSLERSRDRRLERIREEIRRVEPAARNAIELRDRLAAADREAAIIAELSRARPDPLAVLAALSEHLPRDVTVSAIRGTGDDWQVDGTAQDAAAIVPLLDADERFEGVRFVTATSRFREAGRTYETFSIAFRVRPGD